MQRKDVLIPLTWLIGLSAAYASVNIMSNVSSARIVNVGVSVDAGTLLFPLTFVLRDFVHRVGGKHIARRVVLIAALLSAVASANFWVVGHLPADMSVGPQEEFAAVLNITWRIAVAGIIAQVVSELLDTEIYHLWQKKFGEKLRMGRALASNAVSVPVDSITFTLVAFLGVYDSPVLVEIIFGNILLKYLVTVVFSPLITLVPQLPQFKEEF